MRRLALLGATGSIAESTLDVMARHPDRFAVATVAANHSADKLLDVCRRFRPAFAAMLDPVAARSLAAAVEAEGLPTRVGGGPAALVEAAVWDGADTVIAAIVGAAGLAPTLAAARAGRRILLANKETLVIGGALFMAAAEAGGAAIVPIDSEHNAIHQCLPLGYARRPSDAGVRRLLLTASGGPFRTRPVAELADVTPDEACAHPKWRMGRKISVDSATMMNKGLEVIEAHWLFGVPREAIEVVIHPRERHPFAGRVRRRLGSGAARYARHAHADRAGVRRARAHRRRRGAARPAGARRADVRSSPITCAFRASRSRTTRCCGGKRANRAECSERNRRRRVSRRTGALRRHSRHLRRRLSGMAARPVADLDDALAIDGQARRAARERLALPADASLTLAA